MKNEEPLEVVAVVAKGAPGVKGDKGDPGMTPGTQRAIAVLLLLTLIVGGVNLFWSSHEVAVNQAAQHAIQRRVQAAQQRQGMAIERKLCADIGTMAAIKPPAGPAASNPSRAYEQAEHRAWAGLVSDIGCRGETR